MRRRKSRDLSPEERRLWNRVTESVIPARPKISSDPVAPDTGQAKVIEGQRHVRTSSSRVAMPAYYPPVSTPKRPQPLLLAPLDSKSRRRLKRGQNALDATLDLHGLTQAAAHSRLIGFLHQAQAGGARFVLVITGKGKAVNAETGERGILRRMVPIWLSGPELASLVAGFDEAATPHGGAGALYVRLRRTRSGHQGS